MQIFMLVQHPTARGPVPKHTSHLVAALRSLGCTVTTHTWGQRHPDESLLEKLTERFQDVLSVRRTLKDLEIDVAVVKTAHDWHTLLRDIPVVFVIRRRCRRVVLQFHGSRVSALVEPGGRMFKLATAILLALVDGVMVLSTEEQRQLQAFRSHPPVFTVKNPYIRVFPSVPPEPTNASVPARALFVGRLIEEKGIFDLVEAFTALLEETQCDLVMVGEGDQEWKLRDRIRRLGLENHVTLPGYLSGSTLSDRYRESTIFVLPSWSEGFPTVLAEAMDAGLPIVTTRIRGAADHLIARENALFVDPQDVQSLTSAMRQLLQDRELRARMGSANRDRIRIFEPQTVAAEYLRVLRSVAVGMQPVQAENSAERLQPDVYE
jgi:glycosyltransferase involved in cell wall biosynthesis